MKPLTRPVVKRLLEAQRVVQRSMWLARSEVIREQLAAMRASAPMGGAA